MKKNILFILFTITAFGIFPPPSSAVEAWELNVDVVSGNAESRFSFGQQPDATDLTDGLYDVPAMLSGSIQVFSQTKEGSFWRDIRSTETGNEWQLIIKSQTKKPLHISWDPDHLPADASVKLVNASSGKETDMKTSKKYTLKNTSEALFLIEVTTN